MEKIQIKCTSCGQKFAVSESYKNRMVECGACDHRFKVEGAAIIRQKKRYYPGERASVNAESFAKVESDSIPPQTQLNNELGFQPAQYDNHPTDFLPPLGTKRTFLVLTGVSLLIIFLLIFFLGSRPEGILQDVADQKRILLAGFITLLSACLIIGADRRKLRAILTTLILGGALCAIPIFYPVEPTPEVINGADIDSNTEPDPNQEETPDEYAQKIEAYKSGIGYRKVIAERSKAKNADRLKALVIRDIGSHTDTICNYFKYELGLDLAPTAYTSNRELDSQRVTLIILETDLSTDAVWEMTKKFGTPAEMDKLHRELDVIEVLVNDNLLQNANTKEISDETNFSFFTANYRELSNISREKQLEAIRRLSKVKGSLGLRADIATKLANMISLRDHTKSAEAIRALKLWALPQYNLDEKVKSYATILSGRGNLENPIMEYLIEKNVPGISDILAEQWLNSNGHIVWDDLIKKAGSQGEEALIKALPKADSAHLKAASSALTHIGTKRSIPALTAALTGASKEDVKYLKTTIDEIKSRR